MSGRFSRTSAMPRSSTEMVTRSLIRPSLPATLAAMKLNLTADEVLTTTRSVRKRLDFDTPVDRATVEECLEIALQAPTGSNRQGWHWVVVEDPDAARPPSPTSTARNFDEYRVDARRRVRRRRHAAASARTRCATPPATCRTTSTGRRCC